MSKKPLKDPRAEKRERLLVLVDEEPWSTTEELAKEMVHGVPFVLNLLSELANQGKVICEEKPLPRGKRVLLWKSA